MATDSDIRAAYAVTASRLTRVSARQIATAIGLFESGFGLGAGWTTADGRPSYNWGALIGSGDAGSITHGDTDKVGTPTSVKFAAFSSMQAGFAAFMGTWGRSDTLAGANAGDSYATAASMYDHHYYSGVGASTKSASDDNKRIVAYANAIYGAATRVAAATGVPLAVHPSNITNVPRRGGNGSGGWDSLAIGVAAIGVGWWGLHHWKYL